MSPGIRRLQEAEVQRYADYQGAVASGDSAVIKACQEIWLNVFEQLRRVEATNPEVEKSKKESVSIAEVEIEGAGTQDLPTGVPVEVRFELETRAVDAK